MPTATFDAVADFKNQLIRKALVGALLVADYSVAALTAITTSATTPVDAVLADLTGYTSLGKLTADGLELSADISKQEIKGFGDAYPSRVDVDSEDLKLNGAGLETRKATLDAFYNVDFSAVTPSATSGEITVDKPPVPELRDKRVLGLFKDINKANGLPIYMGILFPRANVTNNGSQKFANSDSGLDYPVTAQALVDSTEGTACRLFWGGSGLAGLTSDMGF